MGGDVKTSINGLTLPNVVNNNTCAERRAEKRHWAALPGRRTLGWWWGIGRENLPVKYPGVSG